MTSRALVHAEVDRIADERLDEAFAVVKQLAAKNGKARKPGLMSRLRRVKIAAPADFSSNLDLYTTGEKRVESVS